MLKTVPWTFTGERWRAGGEVVCFCTFLCVCVCYCVGLCQSLSVSFCLHLFGPEHPLRSRSRTQARLVDEQTPPHDQKRSHHAPRRAAPSAPTNGWADVHHRPDFLSTAHLRPHPDTGVDHAHGYATACVKSRHHCMRDFKQRWNRQHSSWDDPA